MLVKPNKLNKVVQAFGESGAVTTTTYNQRFRSFSVYNNTGACTVTVGGNVVTIPVGVTVTWDASTEDGVINRFDTKMFLVNAADCIVAGTY